MTHALKTRTPRRRAQPFPIVGIGASAGGLEAFTQLLRHLAPETGMALVLVQHLDPLHASELTRLLARTSTLPTQEVTHNLRVQPNQVYVIPPNMNLGIVKGVLKLEPRPAGRQPHHAIDFFFESLAHDQHERAIGVVLSGTATDGTLGLEAIKAEGGITFAQDESAKYDSMPHSAIAAGCVDFVLAPEHIAQELERIAKHPYLIGTDGNTADSASDTLTLGITRRPGDAPATVPISADTAPALETTGARTPAARGDPRADEGFDKILLLLRNHAGVDFALYKSNTVQRRIARRMLLSKHDLPGYIKFLRGNAVEIATLFSDLLISVTSFFRNPEAFNVLKRVVFPELLKRRSATPIRVWVLGCSTGQEAYSVSMAFAELVEGMPRPPMLQIFATDLNEALLDKARAGLYPSNLVAGLSPERLRRFFLEEAGGYRVIKSLRAMVIFARQNLMTDPPFSRVDLICCRNLLIYLEPALQKKALAGFHYALKPDGFLFLGNSESVGEFAGRFEPVDKRHKIFAKKSTGIPASPQRAYRSEMLAPPPRPSISRPALPEALRTELSAQREVDRILVNEFAPPGVLINADLQILQFRGPTSAYLMPPRGKASFDVLKMAREGLLLPLRAAINKAKKEQTTVRKENVRVLENGSARKITVLVTPLKNLRERCYLVLFEEALRRTASEGELVRRVDANANAERPAQQSLRQRLQDSERELAETRDYLQAMQEQYDASNEELQASSEEAQSANEELQSINEELESSKEELESANEELTTVNEEMINRNDELLRVTGDLNNLHESIHTAILVLRRDLTIRTFTPLAARGFNLLASDVGRRLKGIGLNLQFPPSEASAAVGTTFAPAFDLENFVQKVIDTGSVRECEVQDAQGHWYALRVRPYLSLDNKLDGAVLALVDIDALKRNAKIVVAARNYAEAIVAAMPNPLLVLDAELRIQTANEAYYRSFATNSQETVGRLLYDLSDGQWDLPALHTLLADESPRDDLFQNVEVTREFQRIGLRHLLLNTRQINTDAGPPNLILLIIEDITERSKITAALLASEVSLREAGERFRLLAETIPQKVFTTNASGESDYFNGQWMEYSGRSFEQLATLGWTECIHPDDLAENLRAWWHSIATAEPFYSEHRIRRADGAYRWHSCRAAPLKSAAGDVLMWAGLNADIQDSKEADQRKDEFLAMLGHELRNPLAPISNALQILRQTDLTHDSGRAALDMVQRQVTHLARLVDDLLDVGRISQGKIVLHLERVELTLILQQSADALRSYCEQMGQTLSVNLPSAPIYLNADPTRLAQIVGNLLNNATKYSERGQRIELIVACENMQAVIRVRDTGIGIAADQLPRIFELFAQVDSSLHRAQGGLGIGLTLAKNLVEIHGGTLEALSAGLNHGAEFIVRLPISSDPPLTTLAADAPQAAPARRRILVVDDNADAANSLSLLLSLSGHEVHTAYDGIEAVAAAAKLQPAVILLDIGLPKLNGLEAARQIRQQPGGQAMVLVALTGWSQEEDKRRSEEAGFDFHLIKPVDLAALEAILGSIHSRGSLAGAE